MASELNQAACEIAIEENERKQISVPDAAQAIQSGQEPSRPISWSQLCGILAREIAYVLRGTKDQCLDRPIGNAACLQ